MKKITVLAFSALLLLSGCGRSDSGAESSEAASKVQTATSEISNTTGYIADSLDISNKKDAEFYIMRVNDDYIQIPGICNWIYLNQGGAYPNLRNGQIAKVTADVEIYDGGEAGYMGNYFIQELKDSAILQYEDVVKDIDIPTATETEKMNYGRHMLQYQHNDELYFIILNRQYIDVFLNDELFMEYEFDQLDNILSPFFEKLNN
ncbi:MAG: hypothetical protein IKI56_09240 [Ruminococcus sp.]|nr:hypothetical protein [Ruminococcus sp.]